MKKLLLPAALLVLMGAGCFPKCIKSRQVVINHKAEEQYSYVKGFWTGLPTKVYAGTKPAYSETKTVCDEYAP